MATSPVPKGINSYQHMGESSVSYFRKTVSLRDWWLIKDHNDLEGKRLAVAGFTCGEQQAPRVFHSAPIAKRYDIFTLETADGIIVTIQGLINRDRTIENGFPSEVFSHFLFGFPPYWEIYVENFFKQTVNTATDLRNTSDLDKLTTDSDVTAVDLRPISSPRKDKVIGENGHSIKGTEDSCHGVYEKFTADTSNISNLNNDATGFGGSVQEKSNIAIHSAVQNDMPEGVTKIPISQNEFHNTHPCSLASPLKNHVYDKDNGASENLPPSSCGLANAVRLMEENIAIEAGLPSSHAVGSSERIDDSEICKKSKKRSASKSKNKRSASLKRISVRNDALEEPLVPKGVHKDNLNDSNFDLVAKDLALDVSNKPKSSKNSENQDEGNKDGLKSRSTNFLVGTFAQGPQALSGIINEEEEVTCKESLFRSPAVRDSCYLEQTANQLEGTMMSSAKQIDAKVDDVTSSKGNKGSVNASLSNSGFRNSSEPLENLKGNQKQKSLSGCPVKHKNEQSVSEVEHLNKRELRKCACSTLQTELNTKQAMLKAAGGLRNLSESLKSKEKNEQIFFKRGSSSTTQARRKIIFDTPVKSPRTQKSKERTCILSAESLNLKRSRSGRLLLPTLDFWRNQLPVYDADRTVTGIQEELRSYGGSKTEPQKKQKRMQT